MIGELRLERRSSIIMHMIEINRNFRNERLSLKNENKEKEIEKLAIDFVVKKAYFKDEHPIRTTMSATAFIILLLVPMFCPIALIFTESGLRWMPLIILVCWGTAALIFLIISPKVKKERLEYFFSISNAHDRFNIIHVEDIEKIEELYSNSALTFIENLDEYWLDFVYNWLYHQGVIETDSGKLDLYCFPASMLNKVYNIRVSDSKERYMSIFLKDLYLDPKETYTFYRDHLEIGARWLDDIVDNMK